MANPNQYNRIITDFLRFLIKKGLYVSFLTNWSNERNIPLRTWLISLLERHKSKNIKYSGFISCMCTWSISIEGYYFWYGINKEWERVFTQKYKL